MTAILFVGALWLWVLALIVASTTHNVVATSLACGTAGFATGDAIGRLM